MASAPALTPYRFPRRREGTIKLGKVGACIYCGRGASTAKLTDEHVIPDGLGGDLVLPASSCPECAAATSRAETHLQREVLGLARSIVGVRSRKRKSPPRSIAVQRDNDGEEFDLVVDGSTPFLLPFFVTNDLPSLVRGVPDEKTPEKFRLALFGPRDWNEKGKEWLGGTGSFKWGNRIHAGIIGQALAKIAHAYTVAVLGPHAFEPLLSEYILATEPPFDAKHIGIYPSEGADESLHYIDLQGASVPCSTALGVMRKPLYVVYLRLFAYQPSPSILVAVGWPRGSVPESLKTMSVH